MNILIQQVTIADPSSAMNGKRCDIFISEGKYSQIASSIDEKKITQPVKIINAKGFFISAGWFDMRSYFREPGEEQKETILSGQNAAAQGGFTGVLLMPSTKTAIQNRSAVEFINNRSKNHAVNIYQSGCLTVNREGKDLTEIYDMQLGGAIAFTDDKRSVSNSGVMLRALQYADSLNALVIAYADDQGVSGNLIANESINTTLLGIKGSPALAEEIDLQRICSLLRYTNARVHISGISSKEAVAVIRDAKAEGLKITCEVYAHHLLLSDESLSDFDSNLKVKPPLRSGADVIALKEALLDGTIDCIASDHSPQNIESKEVEFDYADFGMISLETLYAVILKAFQNKCSNDFIADKLSIQPRKILGLPAVQIKEGEAANFTMFDPEEKWVFNVKDIRSQSKNSPFIGADFKGKVKAIYNNSQLIEVI